MISREQIKAARAMLDWSQKVLGEKCETVSEPTIKLIETGKINSTPETLGAIQKTLEDGGVEFLPQKGVRFSDDLITVIEKGIDTDNVFLKLLDDVYYTLKDNYGELLYSFVDNSVSPASVIEKELIIRKNGSAIRSLVRHGDTCLIYPLDEYRYLPKGYYLNNPALVYGDKFAIAIFNAEGTEIDKSIIIKNNAVSELKKKEFEMIWSAGDIPTKTTEEKTYE